MWHRTQDSKFSYLRTCKFKTKCMFTTFMIIIINTVMTEHIVDVRKGQNSNGFDKFPFEEMEEQSLSILVEIEKQCKLAMQSSMYL